VLFREGLEGSFEVVLTLLGGDERRRGHWAEGGHAVRVVEGVGGGRGGQGVGVEGGGRRGKRDGGLAMCVHVAGVVVTCGTGKEH